MKHVWLALLVAAGGGVARADELTATLGEPVVEIAHRVDVRIADGVAIYKVTRQFRNAGKRADEASLAIDLPSGAAATGLRIKARERWYDGDLMEREKAAALYHELTGLGAWQPKDPALLQWVWADKLHLQVFPVLPGQVSTVEYTLTVPTRYLGGRYWLSYPRVAAGANDNPASRPLVTPQVTVQPAWNTADISIDGKRLAAGTVAALVPPKQPDVPDRDPQAGYGVSTLSVPASSHTTRALNELELSLDIAHTYNSDLVVDLITPQGKVIKLHDHDGSDSNGFHDVRKIQLPPGTTGAGTWKLVASDHAALDTGAIDRWGIAFGAGDDATRVTAGDTPVFIPDAPETGNDAGVATIAIAAPRIETWMARLGRVVASKQHGFARLEVDVAPQIAALPKRAQVVFVVDASFSIGEQQLGAQLDVIRAYLKHVPDAEVEIIVARRHATRRFGRFVSAATAIAALDDRAAFALGNGSAIDEAATEAARALKDRSAGPRRMVVLSDELWRRALTLDAAMAALATLEPSTVVHVVVPSTGDDRVALTETDDATYGPMATRHHGIHVALRGVPATVDRLAPVLLELVRPVRIDDVTIDGKAMAATGLGGDKHGDNGATDGTALKEGDGLRRFEMLAAPPSEIMLGGRMWSDPIRLRVAVREPFSKQAAAMVFGEDAYHELSDDEQMAIARYGAAVSPVTSYVAAEPGTRPSTVGLDSGQFAALLRGAGSPDVAMGAMGHASAKRPDPSKLIDPSACEQKIAPAAGWRVRFDLETTRDEIVDIIPTGPTGKPDAMTACLIETAWSVRLDADRYYKDRDQFHVELHAR